MLENRRFMCKFSPYLANVENMVSS